jgi:hypothetical protein
MRMDTGGDRCRGHRLEDRVGIAALAFYDPRDKRPGLEITSASTWSRTGIALG